MGRFNTTARTTEASALADQKTIPIFSGSVPPGDHTVQVLLSFQGERLQVLHLYLKGGTTSR